MASITFFLLLIIRLALFFTNPHGREEYGNLLSEIAMIVQIVSIFYMVFFYSLFSRELLYGVHSFFVDGYRILLEKVSAMFIAHFIVQCCMLFFVYGIYTIIYLLVGIENSEIYLSMFRFLYIYMLAPLILTLIYGVLVAMLLGTKKISFFAILFLWIITGSVSTEVFFPFFSTVQANELKSLLFIGMNNIMLVYKPFIGFDVHWGNELKLISWFLIFLGIILLSSLRWTIRTRERRLVINVLLAVLVLFTVTSYSAVKLSMKAFSTADNTIETDYYMNIEETESDLRYEIDSYVISMEGTHVSVEVNLSHLDTLEPTFQLYHAYPVREIIADGEQVDFERSGDIIRIFLISDSSSLTFHYNIVDTNFVPIKEGRTVLLANYAWYPKKRASHMYEFNEYIDWIQLSEHFFNQESYHFTLESEEVLFSNLQRQGELYKGEAEALTIIAGQGNQLIYGDYRITYPADWPNMKERVPTVLSQLEVTLNEAQQLAPTLVQSLPKKIVFSNYGLSSLLTTDHLVYNTGYPGSVDSYDTMKDFQKRILQLAVPKKGSDKLHGEWVNMASQFLRKKLELPIELEGRSMESYHLPKVEQEIIEGLYQHYYQLSFEQRHKFLKDWYEEMDNTWDWEKVDKLIKEWR